MEKEKYRVLKRYYKEMLYKKILIEQSNYINLFI